MPKTGATRYQKFLKSEKSKTKLKGKKDLPKGTNVTKTNFKIKKIVIKEQLKKHSGSEALSARKLNVKELLSRLNHFNTHSRIDALNGLKEVIDTHPSLLETNLGELIHGIAPLTLNIEKNVRHESLKVLHIILSNAVIERLDPFFDIMCTYLRSAMTHIDARIQEDSLYFLDILLLCTPKKVAKDFYKIIPNFLDMISKLRVDSKPGRTLTVNLGSQITSVKWRVKVLHRLKDYLSQYVKYNNINDVKEEIAATTKIFNCNKLNYYSLFNPNHIHTLNMSSFSSRTTQDMDLLDEVEKFKEYVDTLMPLLFETWVEVCPAANRGKNMETIISEDAASLLIHTLTVVLLIWNIITHFNNKNPNSDIQGIFLQKYRQSYLKHFVNSFPYVTNIRSKQRSANNSPFENIITDPKLIKQNLEICHLYILFNTNINVKNQSNEILTVLNYIEKSFDQDTQDDVNEVIIKILNTTFSNNINNWTRNLSMLNTLLKKIIGAYFNKKLSSSFRQKIFSVLCKIAMNNKLVHIHNCVTYNTWLKNLPDILLEEEVNVQTINIIHMFAVRSNSTFHTVIKPKLKRIVENLPKIRISDSKDASAYHKLLSLLFYIKDWDPESLDILEKQLLSEVYSQDNVNYILDTLKLCM